EMATVTGYFACLNYQGRLTESKPKITTCFNNNSNKQVFTYVGLRSLNKLHVQTVRATPSSSITTSEKSESDKLTEKILGCGGMNLVFIGAEVGPWSKTGGLGDVLGGLPPVLAVSYFSISIIIYTNR
ncbi:granule-bound glycogen (starch) synthase, partial [Trifolium pratense]